jgi:glycosyltransferase involved in cell wall biosynthesis
MGLSETTMSVRVLNIVTISMSAKFFRGMLAFLNRNGFETALCSSPGDDLREVAEQNGCEAFAIPIEREISPWRDLIAFVRLVRLMRQYRPAIVNASTPKAGLLGMLAARVAGVPARVYMLRGLRLETATGLKALLLLATERIATACANRVVCVSESLRRVYIERGIGSPEKAIVLAGGSSNGVDAERFRLDNKTREEASHLRESLGWPLRAPVVGFVGRLTRDKGIVELAEAFKSVLVACPEARLLLVGDFERGDRVPDDCAEWLRRHPRVAVTGFVADPRPCYTLMNVLAFPSYREGFPNVPLEAAAMELPVVATRVSGCVDAVEEGVTATLVPARDASALAEAIVRYLDDPALRGEHGRAGRERVLRDFRPEFIWKTLCQEYQRLLGEGGWSLPRIQVSQDDARKAA